MKNLFVLVMLLLMGSVMTGCGKTETINDHGAAAPSEEPGSGKEVYWEKTEDLGLQKKSTIRLESGTEDAPLKMVIDEEAVDVVQGQEGIRYENPAYTRMLKKDFDGDGIMEIVLLFFGGAGGTYQDFRMIKNDGKRWNIVPAGFDLGDSEPSVRLKELKNNSLQIDVEKTGYKKIVRLPADKTKEKNKVVFGIGYHFFELQEDEIIVAYRIYVDCVGDGIGDVRQSIRFDKDSGKLVLGETDYMTIEKAEKRKYEK